jgi:septal ring factor EnvC (AmiA/AmiB activator)
LAELQTAIVSRGQELEQLVSNQADLEALIQQIELARQRIPALDERIPFVEQRGNLPRPLAGRLVYGFGSPYGNGNLQRQGIGIYAEEGAQVRAVHGGRVLFANWLQGSGLLLILDHGDGYMSLYGANQSLLNKAGDWVNTGDAIATAGDSGNRDQVALYFEIRLRGQAQDPAIWLGD